MSCPPDSSAADSLPRLPEDELVNAITHGIGFLLSLIGGVALFACALWQGDPWRVAGCGVFATTLVAVYAASTLSHGVLRPELRRLFQILDQGFIYLLIAGTYTPFSLAYLRSGWWWLLFASIWFLALCGCFFKLFLSHRIQVVAVWTYVLLGWMPIIAVGSLIEIIPTTALWWMLIGGLCYTIGAVFLVWDIKRYYFHAIWHSLVIAGSGCHFFAIFFFVAFSTNEFA